MAEIWSGAGAELSALDLSRAQAEVVSWAGRRTLRVEGGLALLPEVSCTDARVEVSIGAEGPAYPGIAFRVADEANYELAYAVPHASGLWDAVQYDPVFGNSNTWQIYYGPAYQGTAEVPVGRWFRLAVTYCGTRAAVEVDGRTALVVERMAHEAAAGGIGLWTYHPAHFADVRVTSATEVVGRGAAPRAPQGAVDAWYVEGYGAARCEPNGVLNLNRYLDARLGEAQLMRRFRTATEGEVALRVGHSDGLSLALDGAGMYAGDCTFGGFADRASRGYAELGEERVRRTVNPGEHTLEATVRVTEPFGWGLVVAAEGGVTWLPVTSGCE